jgi:hypothetical protein
MHAWKTIHHNFRNAHVHDHCSSKHVKLLTKGQLSNSSIVRRYLFILTRIKFAFFSVNRKRLLKLAKNSCISWVIGYNNIRSISHLLLKNIPHTKLHLPAALQFRVAYKCFFL